MKKFLPIALLLCLGACDQQEAAKAAKANSFRLSEQGYGLLQKKQPDAAVALFDQAIAADDKNIRAYQGKGIALDTLGKHSDAETAYEKALKLSPGSVAVTNNLAMSKIMRGKYEDAAKLLEPLAQKQPDNATVTENLALANCMMGKRDEARQLYGKSLKPAEIEDNLRFCNKYQIIRTKKK